MPPRIRIDRPREIQIIHEGHEGHEKELSHSLLSDAHLNRTCPAIIHLFLLRALRGQLSRLTVR